MKRFKFKNMYLNGKSNFLEIKDSRPQAEIERIFINV